MKTNTRGFTLVEAVVVATIVAILAAVAIPMYAGFIADQRQNTVTNLAETAAAAGNAYYRRTNMNLNSPITPNTGPLFLYFSAAKYTITSSGNNVTVTENRTSPKTSSVPYK